MVEILLVIATMCQFSQPGYDSTYSYGKRSECQIRVLNCVDKNTKSGKMIYNKEEALEICMKNGSLVK